MQKAERGFGSGRIVWIAVLGSLGVALAGCGSDESGSSTAATSTTSTSTTGSNPQTAADSGTSTSGSSTSGSTTSGSTTTTGSAGSTAPTTVAGTSLTLGWVAPTQNSNGTLITDLAGYKIHYGTASANYTKVVAVSNPSLSRYVLDSLESGTYFFAITAYNSKGIESTLSGEISATLN
jgi:hypothetical protein